MLHLKTTRLAISLLLFFIFLVQYSCKSTDTAIRPAYHTSVHTSPLTTTKKTFDVPDKVIVAYEDADVYFKVQVAAFQYQRPINDPYFDKLSEYDISMERSKDGMLRYTVGYFKTYKAADLFERNLKLMGYTEAFVAAYDNYNVRLDLQMKDILHSHKNGY